MSDTLFSNGIARLREPPQTLRWYVNEQGRVVEVKELWNWRKSPSMPGRGKCKHFSDGSRLRLLKEIARIDWAAAVPAVFITLTYPDERADRSYKQRTQDIYLMHRYMEKYLERHIGVLWRVEFEDRKSGQRKGEWVCHVHLLGFNVRFIPYQLINQWWHTILNFNGYLRTEIKRARKGKKAASYAAKYAAKRNECSSLVSASYLNSQVGRAWAFKRRLAVPYHPRNINTLSPAQVLRARSVAAENLRWYHEDFGSSFTLFGEAAEMLATELRNMGLTDHDLAQ